MLFNTLNFALFLPVVFGLYWFATRGNLKLQNLLLLVSSYFFYGCWDYRFLLLLIFSTLLDYFTGIKMYESKELKMKKFWFLLSVCINLGFLGIFKYYNFFIHSFADGLALLGIHADVWTLKVILPVGISFYTFHGLSYVIDIYNDRIKPERNFIDYSVFVSFFPLLVAGPIERATHLLPQIKKSRQFDYSNATDGLKQILWGLFKKVVIADNCAKYVNLIFSDSSRYPASALVVAAVFFAFQIYCDFSGYSDIAIGTARLFGMDLLRNFAFPYFSRDIAEFWRRWHISLSTWFRDYLYIPLGGSEGGNRSRVKNTFIIFLVSGFWHGANWTFIAWGVLNAIYIMPSILLKTNRNNLDIVAKGKLLPNIREIIAMGVTFGFTVFAWIFFRSDSITHALSYISGIFSMSIRKPVIFPESLLNIPLMKIMLVFMLVEWIGREQQYAIARLFSGTPRILRWGAYYLILAAIFIFAGTNQQFIYFQF